MFLLNLKRKVSGFVFDEFWLYFSNHLDNKKDTSSTGFYSLTVIRHKVAHDICAGKIGYNQQGLHKDIND